MVPFPTSAFFVNILYFELTVLVECPNRFGQRDVVMLIGKWKFVDSNRGLRSRC
jgi:hypothetical protein